MDDRVNRLSPLPTGFMAEVAVVEAFIVSFVIEKLVYEDWKT